MLANAEARRVVPVLLRCELWTRWECVQRDVVPVSPNDRDRYVPKHPTPLTGTPAFIEEEATGQCEGEALARIRARRPTSSRLRRLEEDRDADRRKHDELSETVTETRVLVGTMSGKLDTVLTHLAATHREHHATERIRISSGAKTIGAIIAALAGIVGAYLAGSGCS